MNKEITVDYKATLLKKVEMEDCIYYYYKIDISDIYVYKIVKQDKENKEEIITIDYFNVKKNDKESIQNVEQLLNTSINYLKDCLNEKENNEN